MSFLTCMKFVSFFAVSTLWTSHTKNLNMSLLYDFKVEVKVIKTCIHKPRFNLKKNAFACQKMSLKRSWKIKIWPSSKTFLNLKIAAFSISKRLFIFKNQLNSVIKVMLIVEKLPWILITYTWNLFFIIV